MPPCLYMPLCLPLCFVCHRLSNLCTTRFHVHNLSISRRVSATFIHRSRLWAWGHHPSTHKIAPNTSFSTPKLPFLSKSDVWPAHYDPAPIWAADDGLINLFPLPILQDWLFLALNITPALSFSFPHCSPSETPRWLTSKIHENVIITGVLQNPGGPLWHPPGHCNTPRSRILQDWFFVALITPDRPRLLHQILLYQILLHQILLYQILLHQILTSKTITPDLLPPPLFPFSICPQFVSVCPAAGKKLNESPSQHTTEYAELHNVTDTADISV